MVGKLSKTIIRKTTSETKRKLKIRKAKQILKICGKLNPNDMVKNPPNVADTTKIKN